MEGIILELQFHLIQGQQFLILFEDGVPGLPQDPDQHVLIQSLHGAEDGKPAQEFRDHAEFLEVIVGDLVKNVLIAVIFILQFRAEPKRGSAGQTFPDNVLQIRKSAAADKEDISGIDGGQGHHAALAAGADRDFHFRPFQELEHALLDRFTADIPGIDILLFGDLIDLIHKDNALLTFFHVIVRRFQELGDHALDIIADIAGFRQGSGVADGKGHIQQPCQGPDNIGLAAAGGADQEDVGFLDLDLIHRSRFDPLIVVIGGNGNDLLGMILTDDIFVQLFLDLVGCRDVVNGEDGFGPVLFLFLYFGP